MKNPQSFEIAAGDLPMYDFITHFGIDRDALQGVSEIQGLIWKL